MASITSAPPIPALIPGRYEVLNASLRLNGVGDPPRFFWVSRGVDGKVLVESSEDEGYWIRHDELMRAIDLGWVRPID